MLTCSNALGVTLRQTPTLLSQQFYVASPSLLSEMDSLGIHSSSLDMQKLEIYMSYSVAIHWLFMVRASDNTQQHKKTHQGRGQQKEQKETKKKTKREEKKQNATSSESSCTCPRSARKTNMDK